MKIDGTTSCHQSVLLKTTQIIQELLLQKCYTTIKPNFQSLFQSSPPQKILWKMLFQKLNPASHRLKPKSSNVKILMSNPYKMTLFQKITLISSLEKITDFKAFSGNFAKPKPLKNKN